MMVLLDSVIMEFLVVGPKFFLLVGAPELPVRRRFLTMRRRGRAAVVEACG